MKIDANKLTYDDQAHALIFGLRSSKIDTTSIVASITFINIVYTQFCRFGNSSKPCSLACAAVFVACCTGDTVIEHPLIVIPTHCLICLQMMKCIMHIKIKIFINQNAKNWIFRATIKKLPSYAYQESHSYYQGYLKNVIYSSILSQTTK